MNNIIEIIVTDMHGAMCQLEDVLIFYYQSPLTKYIGKLEWSQKHYELQVNDGETWYALSEPHVQFERLCSLKDCPLLEREFGKIHLMKGYTIDKIYKMAEAAILLT